MDNVKAAEKIGFANLDNQVVRISTHRGAGGIDTFYSRRKDFYLLDGVIVKFNTKGGLTISGHYNSDNDTYEDVFYIYDEANDEFIAGSSVEQIERFV